MTSVASRLTPPPRATQVLVTARPRQQSLLADPIEGLDLPDPSLRALEALLADVEGPVLLAGGEPTLRADLPKLIAIAARGERDVGLVTDGLALARPSAIAPLLEAGLSRVRVTLHAVRADAHDWLVGKRGATKQAVRALGVLRELSRRATLGYELSATATRPTIAHLEELVALAAELGAARVLVHRYRSDTDRDSDVMLLPRFGLLEPHLERLAQHARRRGVELLLVDFPRCVTGQAAPHRAEPEPRRVVPSWLQAVARPHPFQPEPTAPGCATCLGPPSCRGVPTGYLARYRRDELLDDGVAPTTRLRSVAARAAGAPDDARPVDDGWLRMSFGGPPVVACPRCGDHHLTRPDPEPTRDIRRRLVRAARHARRLRIADAFSLSHPHAAAMLRECLLLFDEVAVAGEASALATMDAGALYHLEGLSRVDAALYGPDAERHDAHVGRAGAFEATLRGLQRLREATGVAVGGYAVWHDDAPGDDFAWGSGALPDAAPPPPDLGRYFAEVVEPGIAPSGSDMRAMVKCSSEGGPHR